MFYKSTLELNGANTTSLLSFDSRSINLLLDDSNSEHFSSLYPMFYQNKLAKKSKKSLKDVKFYYRSSLECALINNQIRAVSAMLSYICKYQNNYVSSYMLRKHVPELLEKGLQIKELLSSNVFNYEFDFDEWPGNHTNDSFELRPYHGTIYTVKMHYKNVFPEEEF